MNWGHRWSIEELISSHQAQTSRTESRLRRVGSSDTRFEISARSTARTGSVAAMQRVYVTGGLAPAIAVGAVVVAGCGSASASGAARSAHDNVIVPSLVGVPMSNAATELACEGRTPNAERTRSATTPTPPTTALDEPPTVSTEPLAGMQLALKTTLDLAYLSPSSNLTAITAEGRN